MPGIDTDFGPFVELVGSSKVYVVPRYQRPYSWRAQHEVAELWGDIVRLYQGSDEASDNHFIGPFIVGQSESRALGPDEAHIIDGQQRLITLSLIVAALRDVLVDDRDQAFEITETYLRHTRAGRLDALRVRPGEADVGEYRRIICGDHEVTAAVSSLIKRAYDFVCNELISGPKSEADTDSAEEEEIADSVEGVDRPETHETDEADPEYIPVSVANQDTWDWGRLLEVIGTQLELVSISGVPSERAYQIFATINHQGLNLSQVDLIRNAVFMLMPTRGEQAHRDLWLPMERALRPEGLESFVHAWVIQQGSNVPRKDTYRSVVRYLKPRNATEDEAFEVLRDLKKKAWSYLAITRPGESALRTPFDTREAPATIVASLSRLREWGTVPMEPLLLEVLERWRADRLTTSQVNDLLLNLESFVVRRFICRVPPNDLRSSLARLVGQVTDATDSRFAVDVIEALREPQRRWPTNNEVAEALRERALYRRTGRRLTFFVLRRLAERIEGRECPEIRLGNSSAEYSIEHVLPQGPEAHWVAQLHEWGDANPGKTIETRTHTIGNLTLTAYNGELSNKPFDQKKEWIRSHLRLELSREILHEEQWTKAQIDERSARLAQIACAVWPTP